MTGQFECWRFDPETNELAEKCTCRPEDGVYIPSMEPHGIRHLSKTEPASFRCCIYDVYEDDEEKRVASEHDDRQTYSCPTF